MKLSLPLRGLSAVVAVVCALPVWAEELPKTAPKPVAVLPLEDFGYRPNPNNISLRAGFTAATVHFIDRDHLLLTFSTRKLMKRSEEQREGDDDHTVRALVIHLPDGKVVRQAEWRMHDRAPYLWPLAHGRFLLRERGNLFSLDPMGKDDEATLGQRLLLKSDEQLEALEFSPMRDVMLVERTRGARVGDDPEAKRDTTVSADFYGIQYQANGEIVLVSRGKAKSPDAFALSFTSTGLLRSVKEDRTHWGFDFTPYGGHAIELAGFTSSCRPHSVLISDTEFFAYGCRGGDDRRLMAGFNLLADAQWVFTTDDPPLWLSVDSAPGTGRFAVRNTLTVTPAQEADRLGNEDVRVQEVRVYAEREGEELLRVIASPAQRPGGNFALSPDGLRLVVLHDTDLELYALPAISDADRKLEEREAKALGVLKGSLDKDIAVALASKDAE